jgi:hypothetical protein
MKRIHYRHPRQIRMGDVINHAGYVVEVIEVEAMQDNWRFRILYEHDKRVRDVCYSNDHAFYSMVARYENAESEP